MTSPTLQQPQPDWNSLEFPSDRVSVADLRRAHPERFAGHDAATHAAWSPSTTPLFATICLERMLAEKAFAAAAGRPDPHPHQERDALVDDVDADYRLYGVSSGLNQSRQLVRQFESAAAAQAVGRSPGRM